MRVSVVSVCCMVVGCPPRSQASAGLGFVSGWECRFRSLDVGVTAVTSQVGHTTGPSDVGAYAASVPKVGAPSHLGPRSRSRPAAAEVVVLQSRNLARLLRFPKGWERDYDARACVERARWPQWQCCRFAAARKTVSWTSRVSISAFVQGCSLC